MGHVTSAPLFVVVSGAPATGKSTLGPSLARELGLPLVAKDTIKEALMSVLPVPDVGTSRLIGRASMVAVFAVAAASSIGAVIEANFHKSLSTPAIEALPGCVVEVSCTCSAQTARQRFTLRAAGRHPGHFDSDRDASGVWNEDVSSPLGGRWPVIILDTEHGVDAVRVAQLVLNAALR